ncbi:ABC transporter ATP-binding protein [Cumulibacter manganitolerans]|uniref:ABC transporter ATP-binding protein n=1 Tax=Cumulibacter manganitolerans TaxID=1884992 RepID=UPI001E603A83|nr:ABC transporter ATP-binding protein [Cumulibacter manganitolerans]
MTTETMIDQQPVEPHNTDALLSVRGLNVSFPTDDGLVTAVRNVSFDLHSGEALGIVGESGSGKSVSAMALMGLLPKSAQITGSVMFAGKELVGMPEKELQKIRGNGIAMIFQDPMTSLNPVMSVGRQLAEAYNAHNKVSKQATRARVIETLTAVGIPQPDKRAKQYPHEFSGGMRQRAMIAMAVINRPRLIIADEPTTALDVTVQAQILETLQSLQHEGDAAVMFITHDLGVVAAITDRAQVMYAGTVVETGPVHDVLKTPKMPYTAGLIASIPKSSGASGRLTPIKGAPPSLINIADGCTFAPRCYMARPECDTAEPPLVDVDGPTHKSRCYFWPEVTRIDRAPAAGSSRAQEETDV